MRLRAIPFAVVAWLFLAGVVVQVFLAGMGVFQLTDWTAHAGLGWGLSLVPFLVVVLAGIAGVDGRTGLATLLLVLSALFQPELAAARLTAPVMAALHPVNALILFALAWVVARRSLLVLRGMEPKVPPGNQPGLPGDSALSGEAPPRDVPA
jgi:hypothetical protein